MRFVSSISCALITIGILYLDNPAPLQRFVVKRADQMQHVVYDKTVSYTGLSLVRKEELDRLLPLQNSVPWWLFSRDAVETTLLRHSLVKKAELRTCDRFAVTNWGCFEIDIEERHPAYAALIDDDPGKYLSEKDLHNHIGKVVTCLTYCCSTAYVAGVERFRLEWDNLRAALEEAILRCDVGATTTLVHAPFWYCYAYQVHELGEWAERALGACGDGIELRGVAAFSAFQAAELDNGEDHLRAGIALSGAPTDPQRRSAG